MSYQEYVRRAKELLEYREDTEHHSFRTEQELEIDTHAQAWALLAIAEAIREGTQLT